MTSALRLFRSVLAALSALQATACSPTTLVNALVPDDGYEIERGLAYGDHPRQHLDIYRPDETRPAGVPVVVFLYGGSWQTGSRDIYKFIGEAFASAGYVTVVPDYRLHPEVVFPAFIEDGAQAVAWVREEIGRFGGDPGRIALMGHSAGAHIAALLTLDRRYLDQAGVPEETIQGLISVAGPLDFLPIQQEDIKAVFEVSRKSPAQLQGTQPITYARRGAPPTLLQHGTGDTTVRVKNSRNLAEALESEGSPATLSLYDDVGHIAIIGAYARPLRWVAPVRKDALDFLEGVFALPPEPPAG